MEHRILHEGVRALAMGGLAAALFSTPVAAPGASFLLPENGDVVVGTLQETTARHEDTLLDIARRFNLGYEEIRLANPGVDPWVPGEGTRIVLPTSFILPDAPREGFVLNLAELRLYYYPQPRRGEVARVVTHPVSIGRFDWRTPLGRTYVAAKVRDPTWYPPESIRAEHAARGDPLPEVVPPGPDNPLGAHALRLGIAGYLIHGTNKPYGVGMRVSHGCIRMYPEDIAALFDEVRVGTPVRIVNQPIKAGWRDGVLFVEAHPLFVDDAREPHVDLTESVRQVIAATPSAQMALVDWDRLMATVRALRGTALPVSTQGIHLTLARELSTMPPGDNVAAASVALLSSGEATPESAYSRPESGPGISLRLARVLTALDP